MQLILSVSTLLLALLSGIAQAQPLDEKLCVSFSTLFSSLLWTSRRVANTSVLFSARTR